MTWGIVAVNGATGTCFTAVSVYFLEICGCMVIFDSGAMVLFGACFFFLYCFASGLFAGTTHRELYIGGLYSDIGFDSVAVLYYDGASASSLDSIHGTVIFH